VCHIHGSINERNPGRSTTLDMRAQFTKTRLPEEERSKIVLHAPTGMLICHFSITDESVWLSGNYTTARR
jgi:hypothetical protein